MTSKRAPLLFTDFCQLMNVPPTTAEHSLGKTLSETLGEQENHDNKEKQTPNPTVNLYQTMTNE